MNDKTRPAERGDIAEVLVALADRGPLSARQIAEAIDKSRVTAYHVVQRLRRAGVITELNSRSRGARGPAAALQDLIRKATGASGLAAGRVVTGGPAGMPAKVRDQLAGDTSALLGVPALVRQNSFLEALAEAEIGAGQDLSNFVMVSGDPAAMTKLLNGKPHPVARNAVDEILAPPVGVTKELVEEARTALAVAITCQLTDPSSIVVSRAVAADDELLQRIRSAVDESVPDPPDVVVSSPADEPVLIGATRLAIASLAEQHAHRAAPLL